MGRKTRSRGVGALGRSGASGNSGGSGGFGSFAGSAVGAAGQSEGGGRHLFCRAHHCPPPSPRLSHRDTIHLHVPPRQALTLAAEAPLRASVAAALVALLHRERRLVSRALVRAPSTHTINRRLFGISCPSLCTSHHPNPNNPQRPPTTPNKPQQTPTNPNKPQQTRTNPNKPQQT